MAKLHEAWGRASSWLGGKLREEGAVQYSYDPEADALSIYLIPNEKSARTVEIDGSRLVDLNASGDVVHIEVLWASRGFHLLDIIEKFNLWDHEIDLKEIQNKTFTPAIAL